MWAKAWAIAYLLIVEEGNHTICDSERSFNAQFDVCFQYRGIPSVRYLILIHHSVTTLF